MPALSKMNEFLICIYEVIRKLEIIINIYESCFRFMMMDNSYVLILVLQ